MTQLEQLWSNIVSGLVVDALIIAAIFGGVMLFAYTVGSQRILTAYFAVAVSGFITLVLPSLEVIPFLSTLKEYERELILFVTSLLLSLIILWQNRFFDPYIVPSGIEKLFFALGLAGWLIVALGTIVPSTVLGTSLPVHTYFFSTGATICWLLAPLILFIVFRGKV